MFDLCSVVLSPPPAPLPGLGVPCVGCRGAVWAVVHTGGFLQQDPQLSPSAIPGSTALSAD